MSDELLAAIHAELLEQKGTLSALTADMKSLVGNGKPGRIDKLEDDVEELKGAKNQALGVAGTFGFLVSTWEIIKWKFRL